MSLFFVVTVIVALLRGKANEIDDSIVYAWALFAIADALWFSNIVGRA